MKLHILIVLFTFSIYGQASTGGGNGGDEIRENFISTGKSILKNYSGQIKKVLSTESLVNLDRILDIKYIKVVDRPLIDNGNSKVDAIGELNSILLYSGKNTTWTNDGWQGIFQDLQNAEVMVLHEMLRGIGVNDDNYLYSKQILEVFNMIKDKKGRLIVNWLRRSKADIQSALIFHRASTRYHQSLTKFKNSLKSLQDTMPARYKQKIMAYISLAHSVTNHKYLDLSLKVSINNEIFKSLLANIELLENLLNKKRGIAELNSNELLELVKDNLKRTIRLSYQLPRKDLEINFIKSSHKNLQTSLNSNISYYKQNSTNQAFIDNFNQCAEMFDTQLIRACSSEL